MECNRWLVGQLIAIYNNMWDDLFIHISQKYIKTTVVSCLSVI